MRRSRRLCRRVVRLLRGSRLRLRLDEGFVMMLMLMGLDEMDTHEAFLEEGSEGSAYERFVVLGGLGIVHVLFGFSIFRKLVQENESDGRFRLFLILVDNLCG